MVYDYLSILICDLAIHCNYDLDLFIFLFYSFEERLVAQRRERELAAAELGFKKPLSKEEKVMKKKERLAAIGKSSSVSLGLDYLDVCMKVLNIYCR